MSRTLDSVFVFIGGCAAGIFLAALFSIPILVFYALTAFFVVLMGTYLFLRNPFLFLCCVGIAGFLLGLIRMEVAEAPALDPQVQALLGERVELEGVVVKEPDLRERSLLLTVALKAHEGKPVVGKVLISADAFMEVSYGDYLEIKGVLKAPENFTTDAGNVFNYVAYLDKDGIHYRMHKPELVVLAHGEGNAFIALLLTVKHVFLKNLESVLPEPEVSLLSGLLLGVKQSLGEELLDAFRITGLIHVVVLSGYNLTLVADAVRWFAAKCIRKTIIATFAAGGAIVLFSLMAGASATVVRATAMALLVLVAQETGRVYEVLRALFVTGFLMLMWNPKLLLFDPSFQLSFLATFGLIVVAPKLEVYLKWIPKLWKLRSIVSSTLSTQLLVLPLILYQTGTLSFIGVLANILVLPLIPSTMLLGFVTGLIAFLHPLLALPSAFATKLLLSYELFIAKAFSALPFAALSITHFPWWGLLLFYTLGFGGYFMWRHRNDPRPLSS
jgi:competence protein ComEC